jgi:hypothetical protein
LGKIDKLGVDLYILSRSGFENVVELIKNLLRAAGSIGKTSEFVLHDLRLFDRDRAKNCNKRAGEYDPLRG